MVKNIFVFLSLIISMVWSSESGVLAYRAKKSLEAGRFAKSYSQLEKALLATRKESDLLAEGRVLMMMAQIRTQSLDFALADSLLSIIRQDALDTASIVALVQAKMALLNAQERYDEAIRISKTISEEMLDEGPDLLQGYFWREQALALTALKKNQEAEPLYKKAKNELPSHKVSVVLMFAQAALFEGRLSEADSLYAAAAVKAIEENNNYISATILFYRAQIALKQKRNSDAEDFIKRSAQAFELMGLPNNQKRSEKLIPYKLQFLQFLSLIEVAFHMHIVGAFSFQ